MVQMLLEKGAKVDSPTKGFFLKKDNIFQDFTKNISIFMLILFFKNGVTPLYVASQNGHLEIVQVLLQEGANMNALTDVI